jgi:type II secretory pathway predicted ATPase ExeA
VDYLQRFGLAQEPFSQRTDRWLPLAAQEAAFVRLRHALTRGKGVATLTGAAGCGKSTLARRVLGSLPADQFEAAMFVIVHGDLTPSWLMRRVATQIGVEDPAYDRLALLAQVYERIDAVLTQRRPVVLLIDEAHRMQSRPLWEELRGLASIEIPGAPLVGLLLIGGPDLDRCIALDPQLHERVAMRARLDPLSASDCALYVEGRLAEAGGEQVFDDEALAAIYSRSGGVPRRINAICDNTLLETHLAGERSPSAARVVSAAAQLGYGAERDAVAERTVDDRPAVDGTPGAEALAVVTTDPGAVDFGVDALARDVASEEEAEAPPGWWPDAASGLAADADTASAEAFRVVEGDLAPPADSGDVDLIGEGLQGEDPDLEFDAGLQSEGPDLELAGSDLALVEGAPLELELELEALDDGPTMGDDFGFSADGPEGLAAAATDAGDLLADLDTPAGAELLDSGVLDDLPSLQSAPEDFDVDATNPDGRRLTTIEFGLDVLPDDAIAPAAGPQPIDLGSLAVHAQPTGESAPDDPIATINPQEIERLLDELD